MLTTHPRLAPLPPDQARRIRSFAHPESTILARIPIEPGARPVFHVTPASSARPRVQSSVRYLDLLVSDYLLDPVRFPGQLAMLDAAPRELSVLFQIADGAADIPGTVGYCAAGEKVTLIPDVHFGRRQGYLSHREAFEKAWIPWHQRIPTVFWRGSSTGAAGLTLDSLPHLPRFRLCLMCANSPALRRATDVKLTKVVQAQNEDERRKIRARLIARGLLAPPVPQTDFLRYRFQLDIDGNSNSWGLLLKLFMGACILKVESRWRQWYYEALRPWRHYVPISNDLTDLKERVAWCFDNEAEALQIAENGRKFAQGLVFETEMLRAASRILDAGMGLTHCSGSAA